MPLNKRINNKLYINTLEETLLVLNKQSVPLKGKHRWFKRNGLFL